MARQRTTDSASQRPLKLRARGDLEFFPQRFGQRRYWVVKDPVTLRYFQLREEEYAILRSLDGQSSLADVLGRFHKRFAPRRLNENHLSHFLGGLHTSGLILSDHPGQAEPLLQRRHKQESRMMRAAASNVLAIRLPGVDPEPFLRRTYPLVAWLFRPWCVVTSVALMLVALLTVLLNPAELATRLPEMQAFFGPANLLWLVVCLAVVKILHELGHAMACRHFECECHEIGALFLVFTPCLYCDITDSWTLTDKRQRMTITAAGIYVELVLASIATLLWWFTADSLLSALCLNVMFLCSVNTVLFNGNPLLRYDGYYLLSDWLEIPNLWQRSRAMLSNLAGRLLFGTPREAALPEERPFVVGGYGLLSVVYRLLVIVVILSFLYRVLRPLELELLAHAITAMTIVGAFVIPAISLIRTGMMPGNRRGRQGRRRFVLSLAATFLVAVCLVPLPSRVRAPALLEAEQAERVFASVSGRIVSTCRVAERVDAGDTLAVLENDALALEIEDLASQAEVQAAHVDALQARRGNDPSAAAELPTARESLAAIRARLAARQEEAEQLVLKAPRAGTVLPAPGRTPAPSENDQLIPWHGLPTDQRNTGAFLETGTLLCSIGEPDCMRAVVYLAEKDVQLVRQGDPVQILLEQSRHTILEGTVQQIDASKLEVVPSRLAILGTIPNIEKNEVARPIETYYRVEIALSDSDAPLTIGMRCRAKITVAPSSIAQRVYRFLGRTFRRAR